MFSISYGKHCVQRYSTRLSSLFVVDTRRPISTEFVKPITVKTCVGLYDYLRKIDPKLYQNAPSDGVELCVDYADTLQADKSYDKVVVAIHGNPGNYTHFNSLMKFYQNDSSATRVIVPNLPDFSHTRKTKAFWHSSKEKSQFLKDFLHQINVKKIDCLVSHSFGVQTIAALWEDPGDIKINSVAMFAPQPLWHVSPKVMEKSEQLFQFKSELWYKLLSLTKVYQHPKLPMKLNNMEEFLLFASSILDKQTPIDIVKRFEILFESNIPVAIVYGTGEKIITKKSIQELNAKFQIKPDQVIRIDPEVDNANELIQKNLVASYLIDKSGHMVHEKRNQFANKIIDNLLNYAKQT